MQRLRVAKNYVWEWAWMPHILFSKILFISTFERIWIKDEFPLSTWVVTLCPFAIIVNGVLGVLLPERATLLRLIAFLNPPADP